MYRLITKTHTGEVSQNNYNNIVEARAAWEAAKNGGEYVAAVLKVVAGEFVSRLAAFTDFGYPLDID